MNSVQRIQAVLNGQMPDHPPVSFWHHFPPDQSFGPAALAAHLNHARTYDLDLLKVMNDNGYPHHASINALADLAAIVELRGDETEFQRQLDLLSDLKRELAGRVPMTTTIFNAWAVLRHLIRPPAQHNPPEMDAAADVPSQRIKEFLAKDELAVKSAISNIATSLEKFAHRCVAAGADGIFLSVREDWVESAESPGRYAQLVRASDLQILDGAKNGTFNMLHVCGRPVDLRAMSEYPIHAINWADRAAGPSIADAKGWMRPAICGGVDNLKTLPNGTPADVEAEVADALRQAGGRPIMITPGCTYDPVRVPVENLKATVRAARAGT